MPKPRATMGLAAALVTAAVTLTAATSPVAASTVASGPLRVPATVGRAQADPAATSHRTTALYRAGSVTGTLTSRDPIVGFTVQARAALCAGAPRMQLRVDRRAVHTWSVPLTRYAGYPVTGSWAAGSHQFTVSFLNDYRAAGRCDRNLYVTAVTATTRPPNPFAGRHGYVDPNSSAARAARAADPTDAALLRTIAAHPQADWVGDWTPTATVAATVRARVRTEAAAGALPVLVMYAIPHRDCGSYSAGGVADASAYGAWVDQVATGIGSARAVVVLEPDALPGEDCLPAAGRTAREQMLAAAVTRLGRQPGVAVYLDAGNETWQPVSVMAARLRAANIAHARGFSLNVSNFHATSGENRYGDQLVAALGGAPHFLVDTSRNGRGSNGQWCNPSGRGLGTPWTTATGDPHADALVWIKDPGESDGTCNGGPRAGVFWQTYALGLARNWVF